MPFGYIKDGQPVEIVSEAVIDDVAHSLGTLMLWTDEERAAIGVMPILPPDPAPEGQRLAGTTLAIVDGQLKHVGVYEDVPPSERRLIPKSVVQERVNAIGKLDEILAILMSAPVLFARWFAPDHPNVYYDDARMLQLLESVGCTPEEIAAITAP